MLSFLSQFLDPKHETPLRLLGYLTVRTMLATGIAFAVGLLIGPRLIRYFRALKFGQTYTDDRVGEIASRFDKKNTPPMGGLIIFVAVLAGTLACAEFNVWGAGRPLCLYRAHRRRVA